jgi:hypothetical protein
MSIFTQSLLYQAAVSTRLPNPVPANRHLSREMMIGRFGKVSAISTLSVSSRIGGENGLHGRMEFAE